MKVLKIQMETHKYFNHIIPNSEITLISGWALSLNNSSLAIPKIFNLARNITIVYINQFTSRRSSVIHHVAERRERKNRNVGIGVLFRSVSLSFPRIIPAVVYTLCEGRRWDESSVARNGVTTVLKTNLILIQCRWRSRLSCRTQFKRDCKVKPEFSFRRYLQVSLLQR